MIWNDPQCPENLALFLPFSCNQRRQRPANVRAGEKWRHFSRCWPAVCSHNVVRLAHDVI